MDQTPPHNPAADERGLHTHVGGAHELVRSTGLHDVSDTRLLTAVVLNQLLTVGEFVAGMFSGSAALLSDAAHNFSDANALLIAFIARRISRQRPNQRYTFGYRRAEMIGAVINLTLLGTLGVYLFYEGVERLLRPVEVRGSLMAAAAMLALVVDVATAVLLWSLRSGSLNVRAAFVHNLVDALASLAVLIGGAVIVWLGWTWIDPVLTLMISSYVLWQVAALLPQAAHLLMDGTPAHVDLESASGASVRP